MGLLIPLFLLLSAAPLWAHGGEGLTAANAWATWRLTPEVTLFSLFALGIYLRGAGLLRRRRNPRPWWRHLLFVTGLAAVFLALQSPLDPIAERSFALHQIQHMLLRMSGPMLLALSAPEAVLVAGLPRLLRRSVLRPLARSAAVQGVAGFVRKPLFVLAIFIGSLYFWQIPAVHNLALLNPVIHYIMHITMLAAGLVFFFVIFDRRHPPQGLNFGLRQLMLVAGIVSNILAGSITTLKEVVVYTAYDVEGRLFTLSALADEQTGGYIIWVPSSMMLLISILITIFRWNGYEAARFEKRYIWSSGNSAALEFPETAEELRLKVSAPNRATRMMLALIPLSIFSIVTATVLTIHLSG